MKQLFFIFSIIPCITFAQAKIDGLGSLKINHTTLEDAKKIIETENYDNDNVNGEIIELKGDYSDLSVEVYLTFFKDTLFSINGNSTEESADFYKAFILKYGTGEVLAKTKAISCKCLGCSKPNNYLNYDSTRSWHNGTIIAKTKLTSVTFYNDGGCQTMIDKSFEIKDINTEKKVAKFLKALENEKNAKKNVATKKLSNKL